MLLYKCRVNKRTGDVQWRIVYGAVATNRHVVHLNPSVGVGCPFCSEVESLFHLFVQCLCLGDLFALLSSDRPILIFFYNRYRLFVRLCTR